MKKIVIIGPAYPLRGGLATFDQRMALQFQNAGYDCTIYSFSLQYPSFLFPGTTQYSTDPPPENIKIKTAINSINPFNWLRVGSDLMNQKPEIIIVRYWLPFMAPALGTILRRVKKNKTTRIIAITDNIFPHEKRPGDNIFTRYFLNSCDAFITMSEKVMNDLRTVEKDKPALQIKHPLYDNFGDPVRPEVARKHIHIPKDDKVLLFFGFIRKYKGLDILLDAMKIVKDRYLEKNQLSPKLLIAGEFYEDRNAYANQIASLGIEDVLILRAEFIPDSDVRYYLCAADVVVQPYRNATQSGVTPLAYHFEIPMIVTDVGSLPTLVPHEKVGLVARPDANAIAEAVIRYFELGKEYFITHLRGEKSNYSWDNVVKAVEHLSSTQTRLTNNE